MSESTLESVAHRAREASHELALATRATKDAALHEMADALVAATDSVLAANGDDVSCGRRARHPGRDRRPATSRPGPGRVHGQGLRDVAALPDPVGEVVRGSTLPNGLELRQVRVPFGVVAIIYEARPNVTADAAGICLKSGNATLLRGSSSARRSNEAIVRILREAAVASRPARRRRPARPGRGPRGGQGTDAGPGNGRRADPTRGSRPDPVGRGGVDRAGDRDRGRQLSRLRRPRRRPRQGTGDRAQRQDPPAVGVQRGRVAPGARRHRRRVRTAGGRALQEAGVTVHGDEVFAAHVGVLPATEEDHAREYLSLDISAAVVPDLEAAVRHIRRLLVRTQRGDRHRLPGRPPAGSRRPSTRRR